MNDDELTIWLNEVVDAQMAEEYGHDDEYYHFFQLWRESILEEAWNRMASRP